MVNRGVFFQMPEGTIKEVADLGDVLLAMGRLQEGVDRLTRDFGEEKTSAAASRKSIYERQEEFRRGLDDLKNDVDMAAVITGGKLAELTRGLEEHKKAVQPSIDDWRRIKNMGVGISGILAIGGLSVGALLMAGLDTFKAAVRSWLGG